MNLEVFRFCRNKQNRKTKQIDMDFKLIDLNCYEFHNLVGNEYCR